MSNQAPSRKTPHPSMAPLQGEPSPNSLAATPAQAIESLAFYRIWQILGSKNSKPPVEPLLPISRSLFYAGIKAGIYPAPVRFSKRVSLWRAQDIRALLERFNQ